MDVKCPHAIVGGCGGGFPSHHISPIPLFPLLLYLKTTYVPDVKFLSSFAGWLVDNGGAMLADPVNLIGVGVGGQAAKQGYKAALRVALKDKMAKEISEITIKEAAKEAEKLALGAAIKKGALNEGVVNAVISGGQDVMLQNTAIKAGIQDEFSLKQSGISTAAGFGFGTIGTR